MTELVSDLLRDFCWAAGIEDTFIPQVRPGLRRLEEYELTQHYEQWQSDFDLLEETGVRAVRWGIPWYRVQPAPDRWEWGWVDDALTYLVEEKGILPIIDLMHYGTPLWLDNSFLNHSYPDRVAEYAAQAAERYGRLTRYFTPFNEPMVCCSQCGYDGVWPPYLRGDDGYVKIAMAVTRGMQKTVRALKAELPDVQTVQVEAVWHLYTDNPELQERVHLHNERQYLCFDLSLGRVTESHPLWGYLKSYGLTPRKLDELQANAVTYDYFGANYYPWSAGPAAVRRRTPGLYRRAVRISGLSLAGRLQEIYRRYQIPVMVTETSSLGSHEQRGTWMDETIQAVRQCREQGIPVVGYTWFPVITMVDWKYRTGRRPVKDYLIHLGLFDAEFDAGGVLSRRRTPLVERYRRHQARGMPPVADIQQPVWEATGRS